jgi:hypothetical protein
MGGTWFSEAERAALETPVIKRVRKALMRGGKREALGLCEELRGERILLHDFFAEACTALWSWTGGELGEKRLEDMFTSVFEQSARRQMYTLLDNDLYRGYEAFILNRDGWVAHSCSGAGEHGGAFRLEEDDEKFTFVMDPCGSGGRLWRKGRYEPPDGFALTAEAFPWSYNRQGFPYYCLHCSFLNEILPCRHMGINNWPVDPPAEPGDVCKWHLYKDRKAVPERYYDRFGLRSPGGGRGAAAAATEAGEEAAPGTRWFSEERRTEMVKPTPDRLAERLGRGETLSALALGVTMGGEFFFLHNLYVDMLVSTLDFIAREAGEERLGDALSYVFKTCVENRILPLAAGMERRDALSFLLENFFRAELCGGAGMPPARFRIEEDAYGVSVVLDPCASGGKLLRHRAYQPPGKLKKAREALENRLVGASAKLPLPRGLLELMLPFIFDYFSETRKPEGIGVTGKAYPWSGMRSGVPYYCCFCTAALAASGCDWLQVFPPTRRGQPCVWRARK